ncbi:MAG TPA: VCBS repeat-containing protein, partial [Phnomibacter sp.]|nr:VCBS repeat-containing protein [Phnomibacter sp.]
MMHIVKAYLRLGLWMVVASFICGCALPEKEAPLFDTLTSDVTGLHFSNQLKPTPEFNLFGYMYYYNGAGVGAGDFNNDGLPDLFFASNQGRNTLFLNTGNMTFKDVTDEAGIPDDSAWSTGVSVVDINGDGLLDIYVCRVGNFKILKGKNQLLINQGMDENGTPSFSEEAEKYGLDFSGFSTQAAFFDYDADGDLDMFLLNHNVNHDGNYAPRSQFLGTFDSLSGHRLYRNDTRLDATGMPTPAFTNITAEAGIHGSRIGYGLGIVISDINMDGLPDIYIGNDFHENDYLYINQGNGTFVESGTEMMKHTSQFSMGVDAADMNNDGLPDIVSMDMLPDDPVMLRRSLSEDDYNIFQHKIKYGYSYQYARNNLQLKLGNGQFSEIAQFAGIHATDWTWSALFADLDNDGHKDLFVSNGIPKRMNDIDYINFVSNETLQEKLKNNTVEDKDLLLINTFPEIKLPNHFFMNNGDLTFSDRSGRVKNNLPTFSNGAVYADLDNDGDLDIVVNNINDAVLVYKNRTNETTPQNRYASIELKGQRQNPNAIGSKLILFSEGN